MDPLLALGLFNTGTGLASDIFGGISARNQQKRMQDIYRQQQDYVRRLTSPEAIAEGTQRLYQPLQGQALTEVNRMLQASNAMQGVQDGGYGQLLSARALAEQDLQRRNLAQNAYLQSIGQAGNVMSQMPRTVGERFGTSGATGQGLSQLAMLYALRGGMGGGRGTTPDSGASGSGWGPSASTFDPNAYGGAPMSLQTDPYFSDPYGAMFSFSGAQ